MRRRLLFSTLAVAVTAVVLFGLPLAFVLKQLQVAYAQDLVQRDATTVARILQNRLSSGLPVENIDIANAADAARSLPDRYVRIYQLGTRYTHFGSQLPKGSAIVAHAVTNNFRVTVEADKSVETAGVSEKLALVISLAALAVAVAVALAMIQAKRLTRPLQELAGAADRLGSGDASPLRRRYGIPELDRVAEGLDGSAQRISELLAAERLVHAAGGDDRGRRPARGGLRGGRGGAAANRTARRRGQPAARAYPPACREYPGAGLRR